ncbi:PREDICTED: (-)-germacrene D synthase-like [Fragaria vesca subsp. vesca]|uniref:(-)-germacrene D synthase-like n=1 Tax=Fragaria vesca subsp. vesca TaxID=101020 RepID=UPI0002C2F079|nr:PREDICTED: (-)-germacrene D synthase-like [Fragaria vesca subsp. vesca]
MDPLLVSASQAQTQNGSSTADVERRSANFSPSVWGEYFLAYASVETADIQADKRVKELKEEVKRVLLSSPPSQRLDLIDYIQRLGLSHHFEDEIHQFLQQIHNQYSSASSDDDDLHTVALRFRLLRQEGFNKVSCDMFNKFIDVDGNLKESCVADVPGLLSLYETAHLRKHGEDFLDRAVSFTTTHLESAVAAPGRLSPPLSNQVAHALYQPLWKGNPRIEARHYLSSYQELNSGPHFSQSLLTFAKLDFNFFQRIHQKELSEITRWWKELDFVNKLPFARDRIVECYFWSLGVCFEPKYRLPRETLCKILGLLTMIDDTFDTYGKLDELELFTEAIQRWDLSAMDSLPDYMKIIYEAVLNAYTEIEAELAKEGNSYRIAYLVEGTQCLVRAYMKEAKWYHLKCTPKTYDEYMRVGLITSGMFLVEAAVIVPLAGEISTRDSLESLFRDPNNKIVYASNILGRLLNDIRSHKHAQKRGNDFSAIQCYMKEHYVTEEEALIELNKQVNDAWKDVNEVLLQPPTTVPRPILLLCLNLLRVTDVIYKNDDGYTNGGVVLKDYITSLLVEPAPM